MFIGVPRIIAKRVYKTTISEVGIVTGTASLFFGRALQLFADTDENFVQRLASANAIFAVEPENFRVVSTHCRDLHSEALAARHSVVDYRSHNSRH